VALADRSFNPFAYRPLPHALLLFVLSVVARFLMITFVAVAVASYVRLKKAEEEQLRAELSLLKAQVNPHFLFNTLNSIYALAVIRSERAPQAITQLAGIMRHVLDETQSDDVDLAEEIASISSYIELEKLRVNENVQVSFSVAGDLAGRRIAPLLLLPLVENAFKHGVSPEKPCSIVIRGEAKTDRFVLEVLNTKCRKQSGSGGMGLANLRRRLALLPGTNRLEIKENEDTFSASLALSVT
jgi:LytS/YehU family sensor histidine kinase